MPLTLRWKSRTSLPVEAKNIRPDALAGLPAADVARLSVQVGNGTAEVGELFGVERSGTDDHVFLEGDLRHVARLGEGMASGVLEIRGDVGPHLGAGMVGGRIDLHGSAGDWAGAAMRGGLLHVHGSAGDWLGSAYPGGRLGMREGNLLVRGRAGNHAAVAMRRGLIAVGGPLGDGVGRGMIAGSVFAFGSVGLGAGQAMKRGSIVLFGPDEPELLPTFAPSGRQQAPFMAVYLNALRELRFPVPETASPRSFARYNGDLAEGGQGEVLVEVRG
jgi:formylmethanofuran dehydrogenase subunit C